MAVKKFLDINGFKHFVEKVIGKTDISAIGDGTVKGAIEDINQSLNLSFHTVNLIYSGTPTTLVDVSQALNYRCIFVVEQIIKATNSYRYYCPQIIPTEFIKDKAPYPIYFISPVDVNVWCRDGKLYILTDSSSDTNIYQLYGVN